MCAELVEGRLVGWSAMSRDDVGPFPGLVPADLADRLLAAGHTPQEILNAISGLGRGFEPPPRLRPTLLPRRERVARYTIRVDLDGSSPRIWRRIELPSDLTLDRVHTILQASMGWTESNI
jgi:hypothetical protein